MKAKIINDYKMKLISATKWNEVWECEEYTMIWNRVTKIIKIKPNFQIDDNNVVVK